jgi:hypothetical protein
MLIDLEVVIYPNIYLKTLSIHLIVNIVIKNVLKLQKNN